MASEIEYVYQTIEHEVVTYYTWDRSVFSTTTPHPVFVVMDEPPEPLDLISGLKLRIGGQYVTVNKLLNGDHVWHLLSCGFEKPYNMRFDTAALFAQAIWLDTILHSEELKGHPVVIATCFHDAIGLHVGELPYELSYNGTVITLAKFAEIAMNAGVDYRLRAWLDGVPLAHVLAE